LLVGRYEPDDTVDEVPSKRKKVALFDLVRTCMTRETQNLEQLSENERKTVQTNIGICKDSTLISTSSGKKHADSGSDWKWWDTTVPQRLRTLYQEK
jgi:bifunctional polynucleotide phosphatase/kinase